MTRREEPMGRLARQARWRRTTRPGGEGTEVTIVLVLVPSSFANEVDTSTYLTAVRIIFPFKRPNKS